MVSEVAVEGEVQETSIVKYRDELLWKVSTNDPTQITKLEKAGWKDVTDDSASPYRRFEGKVITFGKLERKKRKVTQKMLDNLKRARSMRKKVVKA